MSSWQQKTLAKKHAAPKPTNAELKVLSPNQVMAMLAAAEKRSAFDFALLSAGYEFGLRSCEPGLMEMKDLNLGAGTIEVFRVKNSRFMVRSIGPLLGRALQVYLPYRKQLGLDVSPWLFPGVRRCRAGLKHPHGFYLTGQGVSHDTCLRRYQYYLVMALGERGREILRQERKGRNRWHTLKHSLGTHLANAGATLSEIQAMLGHASAKSSLVYMGHSSDDTSREANERLSHMIDSFRRNQ